MENTSPFAIAYQNHNGNLSAAARALNMYRGTLRTRLIEEKVLSDTTLAKRRKDQGKAQGVGGGQETPQVARSVAVPIQAESEDARIARIVALTLQGMGFPVQPPIQVPDVATEPEEVPDVAPPLRTRSAIYMGWEVRVKPDEAFLDCIRQLAKHHDAEIYIVPVWPEDAKFLPESLKGFQLLLSDQHIHENLIFKYVPTHALVQSPVAGWGGAIEQSAIIPGLVKDMRTLPSAHLSKQVMSTGSCGWLDARLSDYSHLEQDEEARVSFTRRWSRVTNRRGGKVYAIAREYTVPSALIVQLIDQKTFVTRYVSMPQKQDFVYDLNLKFTAGKVSPQVIQPPALVMGDLHAADREESTYQAGLEMLRELKPAAVVLNDAFDAKSCAKFERKDAATYHREITLQQEAAITIAALLEIAALVPELVYLHSNHDDHLLEYLSDENNYKSNRNYHTAIKLQDYRIETGRHPVTKLLRMDEIKNLTFVSTKENRRFGRVLTKHGHEGISGKRSSGWALIKVYNFYVDGHGHSPLVFRNGARVGTTGNLNAEYAIGASAWLGTNGIVHADNSLQSLPIIHGKWRM